MSWRGIQKIQESGADWMETEMPAKAKVEAAQWTPETVGKCGWKRLRLEKNFEENKESAETNKKDGID